jgi:hypothetical protein
MPRDLGWKPRVFPALPALVACTVLGASHACGGTGSSSSGDTGSSGGGNPPGAGASVLQFHNHASRDGFFVDPAITKAAAATFHRDATFDGTIAGHVYASPLFVDAANGPGGKAAVIVATQSNNVYALDESTGKALWQADSMTLGTAAKQAGVSCGNVSPLGITGTPAIDLGKRLVVLDAITADAGGSIGTHVAYGLSLDDGKKVWSVDLSTVKDPMGNAFSPKPQNQRGGVLIAGGVAYFVFGGHIGDCGSYHGWVIGVPLDGNAANVRAFRTQVQGAGIWAPGGASSDGTSIFVSTGNATAGSATWQESEGIFRFGADLSFTNASADFFSPANWANLDQHDTDISGSGPLVIDAPAMTPSALLLAQGKDGNLYLLDRGNLGGLAGKPLGTLHVLGGEISQAGAWATVGGDTYVVVRPNQGGNGVGCPTGSGDLVAVKLDPSAPSKMSVAWCADAQGEGSPIITTSDGSQDAMVWVAGAEGSNKLHAWDLRTGAVVFNGGAASDQVSGVRHFSTVLAADGRIVVAGDGRVFVFRQ